MHSIISDDIILSTNQLHFFERFRAKSSRKFAEMCADPEYLHAVRMLVRGMTQVVRLENRDDLVTLAVEEALTNVICHSYGGPCDRPIVVKLIKINYGDQKRPALEVVIRDFGRQVDPESIKGRDLGEFQAGGLDVHITHLVMDEIEFSHVGDCRMQLRMPKIHNLECLTRIL